MVWRKEASGLNILSGIRKGKKAAVAGSGKGWKITSVRTFLAGMKNCCRLGGRRLQRTKSNSVTLQFRKFGNKFYTKCNLLALQGALVCMPYQWLPHLRFSLIPRHIATSAHTPNHYNMIDATQGNNQTNSAVEVVRKCGVGCRIFKWISHLKEHKYFSGNKCLWTKVTNLTIHINGNHGVLLNL